MLKVSVFGTGYVGLVTGACLAEAGHHVLCADIDEGRILALREGRVSMHEPGLELLVQRNLAEGRLRFTASAAEAVAHGQLQFIAVGTPALPDGSADVSQLLAVADAVGLHMESYRLVVNKSTAPVGTVDAVRERVQAALSARGQALPFDVVCNPEFLKEGTAVADFLKPDRIVLGGESPQALALMRELYAPFNRNHDRVLCMDARSAELGKYAANAMLASRISFMNEIAGIAERTGADIEQVRKAVGSDPRIGWHFLYAGCGWGGSCFPKDLHALRHMAAQYGVPAELLAAVQGVNDRQKTLMFDKLADLLGGPVSLRGAVVAIWGLAFKAGTADLREACSLTLMHALWQAGARVQTWDPAAMNQAGSMFGPRSDLAFAPDKYAALEGADALVVCTEWPQFRAPDMAEMAARMRARVVLDGRNLYEPATWRAAGWRYASVGRP